VKAACLYLVPNIEICRPRCPCPDPATTHSPRQVKQGRRACHGSRQGRRGEHGGGGPGVGRDQRAHAPGSARLGPPRPRLPIQQRPPAVGSPPPDVAVLGAVCRQPVRIRGLLRAPRRCSHLGRRARHQRRHLRLHGRHRCDSWRARAPRAGRARHRAYRPRRLGLHLLVLADLLQVKHPVSSSVN